MMLKPLNSTILPSTNHGYYGEAVEIQYNCCLQSTFYYKLSYLEENIVEYVSLSIVNSIDGPVAIYRSDTKCVQLVNKQYILSSKQMLINLMKSTYFLKEQVHLIHSLICYFIQKYVLNSKFFQALLQAIRRQQWKTSNPYKLCK